MKKRQLIPDWLKGLAIVLMVYGHTTHLGSLAIFQKQAVEMIYTFHMPIFLIISGYFFNMKNISAETGNRLVSRIVRPYLIFASLYLIGLILIQRVGIPTSNPPPSSLYNFLEIIFLHPRGAYWFLHSLILIQLSLVFTDMLAVRMKMDESTSLIISLFILAFLCAYNLLKIATTLYFVLGIVLRQSGGTLPTSLKIGFFLMPIIFLFARDEILVFSFIQVVWTMSIMAFLSGLGLFMEKTIIVSIFAWFGRNSLIILVFHAMFIVLLKPLSYLILKVDPTGLAYSVFVLITTLFGCMLAASLFDRIRASSYLFGAKVIYSNFRPSTSII